MDAPPIADQALMEKFFASHLEFFENAKRLVDLKIFRHDPSQVISQTAVLVKYEVTVETPTGKRQTFILRGSSDHKHNRRKSFFILLGLQKNGFHAGPFVVPNPLGYFKDLRLLLYRNFPGPSLMQEFERGKNHLLEKIDASVNWLVKFHSTEIADLPKIYYGWKDEVEKFQRLARSLADKFTNVAPRIAAVVEALAQNEQKLLRPKDFVLVHGDFQPNNVLIRGGQTSVIDFNDSFFYDELFDIVYFKVQTQFMLKRLRGGNLDAELERAIDRYLNERGIPKDTLTQKKIALFTAKTLLRIKVLTSHELGTQILKEIESCVQQTV